MKNPFSQTEMDHIVIRLLIMIKAKDKLIYLIDEIYITRLLTDGFITLSDGQYNYLLTALGATALKIEQ